MSVSAAFHLYCELVNELWTARAAAPGGHLSQDDEALAAEALDDVWNEMSETEHELMEVWLKANRPT